MTQEEKDLLLKDLCARLPYKVIVKFISYEGEEKPWFGELSCKDLDCFIHDIGFIEIKPYLFPLSSMTDEQKREFDISMDMGYAAAYNEEINCANRMIDFFNKNHLDYRGLIEKGLAINATGLNIY